MWTIGEVKSKAWNRLKIYYWPALGVTLIYGILSGGISNVIARTQNTDDVSYEISRISPGMWHVILFTLLGLMAVAIIFGVLFSIFVSNPLAVGKNRYFMESRAADQSAGIGKIFWVFSSGHYLNVVKIMFLMNLYTFLWSLLLVIPGIIKGYEYAMIPYILSENPEADAKDVFALSKDMMTGNKMNLFLLGLSFIGWCILGIACCGIGALFVVPYVEASTAEVYGILRREISGFPFSGYGYGEEAAGYQQDFYK